MFSMSRKSVAWNPPLAKGDLGGFVEFVVRRSGYPKGYPTIAWNNIRRFIAVSFS